MSKRNVIRRMFAGFLSLLLLLSVILGKSWLESKANEFIASLTYDNHAGKFFTVDFGVPYEENVTMVANTLSQQEVYGYGLTGVEESLLALEYYDLVFADAEGEFTPETEKTIGVDFYDANNLEASTVSVFQMVGGDGQFFLTKIPDNEVYVEAKADGSIGKVSFVQEAFNDLPFAISAQEIVEEVQQEEIVEEIKEEIQEVQIQGEPENEETQIEAPTDLGIPFLRAASLKATPLGEDDSLVINKTATRNSDVDDATYTIELEAYATGQVTSETTHIPADVVLVLDQSGSMNYHMEWSGIYDSKTTYYGEGSGTGANRQYFEIKRRSNGTWYRVSNNNSYNGKIFLEQTRRQALQAAVKNFLNQLQADSTANDITHRVSIVGFGDDSTHNIFNGSSRTTYNNANNSTYNQSWKNIMSNNAAGYNALIASVGAIQANGATGADIGMTMANRAFVNIPELEGQRNRVVVMFTDGVPTTQSDFSNTVANGAILQSSYLKADYQTPISNTSGKGATVYTVGVLDGANVNDVTTNINKYMNYTSSNFPTAKSMSNEGTGGVAGAGYYLAATNAEELANIFQSISENIGGTSSHLTEEAILSDEISDYFSLIKGSDGTPDLSKITIYTADYMGTTGGVKTWGTESPLTSANLTIEGNKVMVNGFSYRDNYVLDIDGSPRGKKVILRIEVERADGFIGGNQVESNGTAGVYEDDKSTDPIKTIESPNVNVPLMFTAETLNKSIYIGDTWNAVEEFIKNNDGIPYKIPGDEATYYLGNSVTNQFVNVVYEVKDGDTVIGTYTVVPGASAGTWNAAPSLNTASLTGDRKSYTVKATVTPKDPITDNDKDAEGNPIITQSVIEDMEAYLYIFKPKIEVKDSWVYLGETANLQNNIKTDTVQWLCKSTDSNIPTPTSTEPDLVYDFINKAGTLYSEPYQPIKDSDFDISVRRADTNLTITSSTDIGINELDPEPTGHISNGENVEHQFTVYVVPTWFEINKVDGQDKNIPLDGVVFELYKGNNLVGTVTTANGGIAAFNYTTLNNYLGIGEYTLKEITTVEGYELPNRTWTVEFVRNGSIFLTVITENIPDDATDPEIGFLEGITIKNFKTPYVTLVIEKTVNEVNPRHGNAVFTFEVTRVGDPDFKIIKYIVFEEGKDPQTQAVIIEKLPVGTYEVKELETLRYELIRPTTNPISVAIEAYGTGKAEFENKLSYDSNFSHGSLAKNEFSVNKETGEVTYVKTEHSDKVDETTKKR